MKIKSLFCALAGTFVLLLTPGCGKEDTSSNVSMTPEQTAAVFERSLDRAKILLDSRSFVEARDQIAMIEKMELTPEQRKQVDAIKARIPAQ